MRIRKEVMDEVYQLRKLITDAHTKINILRIEAVQITDEKYRYEEKEEIWDNGKKGKRNVKETHLVGRQHWREFFQDESKPKGEGIWIDRTAIVKVDGAWQGRNFVE